MKNRIIQLLTLAVLVGGDPAWAGQQVTVHVKGMVCDLCARGLAKGFSAFKETGVLEDFKIELAKHTVDLMVKDGASVSDDEITKVIEGSSMAVDKIER
ncbi:hypothetical protein K2X33_14800 [bacterium]|nr:hypothetical protein [bacterium]